jgi:hypothetical protein
MTAEFSGWQPTIVIEGEVAFKYPAIPDMSPPPPSISLRNCSLKYPFCAKSNYNALSALLTIWLRALLSKLLRCRLFFW